MLYDLTNLVDIPVHLYQSNLLNTFQLNDLLFEVLEDENDGWRSSLGEVEVTSSDNFHPELLGVVKVTEVDDGYFKGFNLIDVKDGHVWFKFGTDNYGDWYPCFTFEFNPHP
jgi:hypothetical protein